MTRRGPSVASAAIALVLGVGSAWAQQPGSAIEQQHRRGIAMLRQGQNEQALGVFREIYERTREPRALWRMATAEAALGRWVEAEGHMSSAFGSTSDPWIRAERAGLEQTLRQVQARVGLLTVRCNVPGASIEVDGQAVTTFPLRVVAGDVRVRVRAEGYQVAEATISVPGNVERAFVRDVELRPVAVARRMMGTGGPVGTTAAPSARNARPGAGPWVLVGIGGAAAIAGGVLFVLAGQARSDRDGAVDQGTAENADSRYRTLAYSGDGLMGAAILGMAVGLIWGLTGRGASAPPTITAGPLSGGMFIGAGCVL